MLYAILAAVLYGISAPFSKILLTYISPTMLAAFLYLGAGCGMLLLKRFKPSGLEARLTKNELPYVIGMVLLDIAAPILLLFGLKTASSATVSLLGNFEIVATALIAFMLFHEAVSRRLLAAIGFITIASMLLSVNSFTDLSLNSGALFVLLACACWGFENNCTRMLSLKDPMEIVIIKGFGSGIGSFIVALFLGERAPKLLIILPAMLLGFVAYGLSIFYYVSAQRTLGAARTGAYYAIAPFVGTGIAFILFKNALTLQFLSALLLMLFGAYLAAVEKHSHSHKHEQFEHEHRHNHADGHHNHVHPYPVHGEHSHAHIHDELVHTHAHTPDMHHQHSH